MKKTILISFAFSFTCFFAQAQTCPPGSVTFTTQTEIDNFSTNYPGCTTIEGNVFLHGNSITNLNGLSAINAINGITVNAPNLSSFAGLEKIDSLDFLNIYESALPNLNGLQNLRLLKTLIIGGGGGSNNPSFVSLNGIPKIRSISRLSLFETPLVNLSGLENITDLVDVDINGNPELVSLDSLNYVDSVSKHLLIRWNPKLMNLNGLQRLKYIGGDFGIWSNLSLTSLEGLGQLVSVGETNEGEGMNIFNNPLLSTCSIEGVCAHLQNSPSTSYISDNGSGCASIMEVESQCSSSTQILNEPLYIVSIFPNPNAGTFTVELPVDAESGTMLCITDLAGRFLLEQKTEPGSRRQTVQAGVLPNGLYFIRVKLNGKLLTVKKFVKQ